MCVGWRWDHDCSMMRRLFSLYALLQYVQVGHYILVLYIRGLMHTVRHVGGDNRGGSHLYLHTGSVTD